MSDEARPETVTKTRPDSGTGAEPAVCAGERFHSLDALRAFALLLGVVFHAAESFEPGIDYWAIADRCPSLVLSVFRHACHSFRLEIFFLIAGFFARLVYYRRGAREFVRNRTGRILVPLVVGWVILYPLLVYLWLMGASVEGRLAEFGVPGEMTGLPLWQLTIGFFVQLGFVERFDLTHLWFLHQLLVLYVLMLGGLALWRRLGQRGTVWLAGIDGGVAGLCRSGWSAALFAAATVPVLMSMRSWDVDTPKESLWPSIPATVLFGLFFATGWLLHRQTLLLEQFGRFWRCNLVLGGLMVLPTRFGVDLWRELGWGGSALFWVRLVHSALYGLMMWGFVLGFLGLFVRFCRKRSAGWRYVADSSYWIYLAHLPLVVWLQVQMGPSPLPWILKYPLLNLAAFPVLFLSYHYLVRSTFIGAQLNGRTHPFHDPLLARLFRSTRAAKPGP